MTGVRFDCTAVLNNEDIIKSTRKWLDDVVVGLNLCPFAKRELIKNRIRFSVSNAKTEEFLLADLEEEIELLNRDESLETTLLICSRMLRDFYGYNQFLDYADGLLKQLDLEGVYQIASFHPNYQFAGTHPDDAENYTNRSPYPILHLLREESVERAILNYPNADLISDNNIELMKSMGAEKMDALLRLCCDSELK